MDELLAAIKKHWESNLHPKSPFWLEMLEVLTAYDALAERLRELEVANQSLANVINLPLNECNKRVQQAEAELARVTAELAGYCDDLHWAKQAKVQLEQRVTRLEQELKEERAKHGE